jgi:uncharacterized protein YprB with RNaseH-like and TPR domain
VEKDHKRDGSEAVSWSRPDHATIHYLPALPAHPASLESLLPGEQVSNEMGSFWFSLRPMSEFWAGSHIVEGLDKAAIYFDLEAAGGRGKPLFLAGAAIWDEDKGWMLWHGLARHPDEEAALLHTFAQLCLERPRMVSYSGTKNDWPFLRSRWDRFRQPTPRLTAHLDLFDLAHARYRGMLPACRLVTLEKFLLGRHREDDLPSGFIPLAWEDYLRSGDGRLLAAILYHNLLDIVALLELQPILEVPFSPMPVPPVLVEPPNL